MVTRDNELFMAYGVMGKNWLIIGPAPELNCLWTGGFMQPQGHLQVMLYVPINFDEVADNFLTSPSAYPLQQYA